MPIESKPDAGASTQGPRDMESAAERDDNAVSQTWDPYEVWLQRVRLPRDVGSAASSTGARQRFRERS